MSAPPPATIRPYTPEDLSFFRYLIGSNILELGPKSNAVAFFKPRSLLIWFTVSTLVVIATHLVPNTEPFLQLYDGSYRSWHAHHWIRLAVETVRPIPPYAFLAIATLAIYELIHRRTYDRAMRRSIGGEDMREIVSYYALEKKSKDVPAGRTGAFVLEYGGRTIGAAALDGRKPDQVLHSVEDGPTADDTAKGTMQTRSGLRKRVNGTPQKAIAEKSAAPQLGQIRHFATSSSFRAAGIEEELLSFLLNFAFAPSSSTPSADSLPTATQPAAERVEILVRPTVQPTLAASLRAAGFTRDTQRRDGDNDTGHSKAEPDKGLTAAIERVVGPLSPFDLTRQRFVLARSEWERRRRS